MPKYFCEYCGIYLTHSSPGGRKQHSHGRKHINNKIEYYSQFLYEFQQNNQTNVLNLAMRMSAPTGNPGMMPKIILPGSMRPTGAQMMNPIMTPQNMLQMPMNAMNPNINMQMPSQMPHHN
jgi:U1 small nuclear ribonucleoprotein C